MEKFNTIYKVISGSHAYGLANENSDFDYRGVCIPGESVIFGLDSFDQQEGPEDCVVYSLKKFMNLALQNNPNILELFYIDDPSNIIVETEFFKKIKKYRSMLLSKRIFKTYIGYAEAQAKRMCSPHKEVEKMTSKRKELVEKFGYDTKAASHLFRLIFQAQEISREGYIFLPMRKEARERIIEIRNGKFSVQEAQYYAKRAIDELRAEEATSKLPEHPDYNFFNEIVVMVTKEFFYMTNKVMYNL